MLGVAVLYTSAVFGQDTAQVDHIFAAFTKPGSPGCAMAVIQEGGIVYKHAYGMANLDHNIPIATDTVFHVASVSKQFTAASVTLLALEGKLSLDDEVRKHIPELPDFGTAITIRHLIHHTSGLRDQWSLLGFAGWRYSQDLITDDDVLELMARQRDLNFPPGAQHMYCNTGYTLLAQIVKRVSGMTFREFTNKRIFAPLGMKNTHFRDDHAEIVKTQAYGYVPARDSFRLSVTNFDTVGATSLLTTVEDLAQWDRNFYDMKVGGQALQDQIHQRGKLAWGETIPYAFGLSHGEYRGLRTVGHGGSDAGYRADVLRFPEQKMSFVCLCNLSTAGPGQLNHKVADVYLAKKFTKRADAEREPPIRMDAARLAAFAGLYWNSKTDDVWRLAMRDGKLEALSPESTLVVEPLARSRFRVKGPDLILTIDGQLRDRGGVYERTGEHIPSAEQLLTYSGEYHSREFDNVYRIAVEKERLVLRRSEQRPATLAPTVRDLFQSNLGSIRFTRNTQGAIDGFLIQSGRIRNLRFYR